MRRGGGITFAVQVPDVVALTKRAKDQYRQDQQLAALRATDKVSKQAQRSIQAEMRAAGLGRLANAVGHSSALKAGQQDQSAWGVIFARGGDESLAGGALEAYSRGVVIRANKGTWLAFQTPALQRRVGGRRLTPALYAQFLQGSLGRLHFIQISSDRAILVLRGVSVGPKTGRARARGPRARGKPQEVVAFVLIRQTRRAQRFDKDAIFWRDAQRLPDAMAEEMQRLGYDAA